MADETPEQKLVKRRHPDHVANCDEWRFLLRADEGGPGYVDGNLFRHPKEDPTIFQERKKRAVDNHFNLTALVLDSYQGFLFQQEPELSSEAPEFIQRFIDRADLEGNKAITLAKQVARRSALLNVEWVCVDKPRAEQPVDDEGNPRAMTVLEEKEAGLYPYAYLVDPTHVLDWRMDRGQLVWFLVQEDVREDEDPWASSGEIQVRYRLWERHHWTLLTPIYDDKGTITGYNRDTQKNPIGEVPFVPFRYHRDGKLDSKSMVRDIAHLDRGAFNKSSLLDEILYAVTFPQLAVPFKGKLYGPDGLTPEGHTILTMGLDTVLPYGSETGAPSFIAPPDGPATVLEANIEKSALRALALALLDGEVGHQGGEVQANPSGVSRAYVFEKLNRRLATIADDQEQGWAKVFRLVALWLREDPDKLPANLWDFPDTFEVRSLAQELADALSLKAANIPSPTFRGELDKSLVRKALPKIKPETLEAIDQEIEQGSQDEVGMYDVPGQAEEDEGGEQEGRGKGQAA